VPAVVATTVGGAGSEKGQANSAEVHVPNVESIDDMPDAMEDVE
jgi:hypothetical protein